MIKRKYRTYDDAMIEHYKKHPEELKGYVTVALEEYQKDGDEKAFLSALSLATQVKGGFGKLSKTTGLSRANLYRALSLKGDPRLSTLMQVMGTLGMTLKVV